MNIKRFLTLCLVICLALSLIACGNTQAETPKNEETQAPTANQTEAPEVTDAPTENSNPVYTVKIVDEAGNPVVGAMVQICQGETCMPGPMTGADGTVTFQVAEANYKVSFLGSVPAGYAYTTEETEFYFEAGSYEMTIVLKAVA